MEWAPIFISAVSSVIAATSLAFTAWRFVADRNDEGLKSLGQRAQAIELAMARMDPAAVRMLEDKFSNLPRVDPSSIKGLEDRMSKVEQYLAHLSGSNLSPRVFELERICSQHSVDLATFGTSVKSMIDVVGQTSEDVRKVQNLLLEG